MFHLFYRLRVIKLLLISYEWKGQMFTLSQKLHRALNAMDNMSNISNIIPGLKFYKHCKCSGYTIPTMLYSVEIVKAKNWI